MACMLAPPSPSPDSLRNPTSRFDELLGELAREHMSALERAAEKARLRFEAGHMNAASSMRLQVPDRLSVYTHAEEICSSGNCRSSIVDKSSNQGGQTWFGGTVLSVDRPSAPGTTMGGTSFLSPMERHSIRASLRVVLQDYQPDMHSLSDAVNDAKMSLSIKHDRDVSNSSPRRSRLSRGFWTPTSRRSECSSVRPSYEDQPARSWKEFFEDLRANAVVPIHPDGAFMEIWRPMLFVAVLLAVTMAPFEISFDWWTPPGWYKVCSRGIDVLFMVDMALNFNLAYIDRGRCIDRRANIAEHYMKSWFFIDLLSNTPFDWMFGSSGKGRKLVKFLKVPKLLRMVKLLRTLKDLMQYVGVPLTFGAILLAAHYYACLWVFVELTGCDELVCPLVEAAYIESLSITFMSMVGADARRRIENMQGTSNLFKFRAKTDSPVDAVEDLLLVFMTGTGLLLIACLFANTASALTATSAAARRRTETLAQLLTEMRMARVPRPLRKKVRQTYEHMARFGKSGRGGMLEDKALSLDLRRNLAYFMYGEALRRVPILSAVPDRYVKCLAQKVQVRAYTPGDLIIMAGEVGQELFIIHRGSVRPLNEDGTPHRGIILREGSFFGEACFLDHCNRRTESMQCLEFCDALVLSLEAFNELSFTGLLEEIRIEAQRASAAGYAER
eukprot:CAMPEP_0170236710 /NCGR_PEP_ID=MMETSP0116_2-20130129/18102_1 /TAXON_ID=400756 /ORGANISM="Durinskia baltica, Strain CSIRO CS-38" /LENGTH=670 /DNA_ID=CAMNT_0010487507 /DNA_START=55 /DNA_END=2067 /DNA_ORIENTATION=-